MTKRHPCCFALILLLCAAPLVWSHEAEDELFDKGYASFEEQKFGFAFQLFEDFVRLYPLSDRVSDAQYFRAASLFHLERYREALDLFEEIGGRYRSTRYLDLVPYWKGMSHYALGEVEEAANSFSAFLEDEPAETVVPKALLYYSRSLIEKGESGKAGAYLERLLESYADSPEYEHGVALYVYVLLAQGRTAELLSFLETPPWEQWSSPWVETLRLYKAEALWRDGRRDEAENLYWTLLDMPQELSMVAQQRLFLSALGENNVAVMRDMMNRAEREFPVALLKEFWFGIGVGSYRSGNKEVAEQFLQKIWDLRASEEVDALVPILLARILWEGGQEKEAVALLEEYLKTEEDPGVALKRLGDYQRLSKDYASAAATYERYIDRYPESSIYGEAVYHLAFTYYRQDETGKALEWLSRAAAEGGSPYYQDILRLRIELLKKLARLGEALRTLREYTAAFPADVDRRLDVLRIHFELKDFASLLAACRDVKEDFPALSETDRAAYLFVQYLEGMGFVSGKAYRQGLANFREINAAPALGGLSEIEPYSRYYEGWCLYKLGALEEAGPLFSGFAERYPGHELYTQALYLAGWSFYSSGQYGAALDIFTQLAEYERGAFAVQATFLAGKSYRNLGDVEAARQIFRSLYKSFPESSLADDALYEFAGIEADQGRVEEAAESYLTLRDQYPDSPLGEEALFRRGQLYLNNRWFEQARDAFYDYRLSCPAGSLVDASLYWSGVASRNLDELFGAVLYWEIIVRDYPESSFRPDALEKTAEVYRQSGKFQEAKELLLELLTSYPEIARKKEAEKQIKEIDFLISGLSEREAELSVVMEAEGVETGRGRQAMLEYARMLLEEPKPRTQTIKPLLNGVLEFGDPASAMEAQFLLGELAFAEGLYTEAANAFLKAALIDPSNGDLAAYSLLRAAEMLAWAGREKEVRELVERLESNFPGSQWVAEGKRLLEEMK